MHTLPVVVPAIPCDIPAHQYNGNLTFQHVQQKREILLGKEYIMSKAECKMKLKHQLEIGRRLHRLGLFAAATESRTKARVLLQIYKRHFREQVVKQH